jgi:hypothetical protein
MVQLSHGKPVEIRMVANGWIVTPPHDFQSNGQIEERSLYVFVEWEAMIKFIGDHFSPAMASNQPLPLP